MVASRPPCSRTASASGDGTRPVRRRRMPALAGPVERSDPSTAARLPTEPGPRRSSALPGADRAPGSPSRSGRDRRSCCSCSTGSGWDAARGAPRRSLPSSARWPAARSPRSPRRPPRPRSRRSPPGWRRSSTGSSGFRMRVDGARAQRPALAASPTAAARPTRSGAAPHRVPRPPGPGGDARRSSARPGSPRRTCAAAGSSAGARPSVLVEHCRRLVGRGERFVYAYYPGVDTVAHEFGLHDEYFRAELAFADELVGRLLDALPAARDARSSPPTTAQVHVGDDWIDAHAARASSYAVLRGRGPVPLPLREQGRAPTSCSRPRARRVRRTWRGCARATSSSTRAGSGPAR